MVDHFRLFKDPIELKKIIHSRIFLYLKSFSSCPRTRQWMHYDAESGSWWAL